MTKKTKPQTVEVESEVPEAIPALVFPSLFEENGNSTQYNWNQEFVTKVTQYIFNWFRLSKDIYFWEEYPREYMAITSQDFQSRMSEYPLIWNKIRNELDAIETQRLISAGLDRKLNASVVIWASKHMGKKWKDETTLNLNTKSIADQVAEAFKSDGSEDIIAQKHVEAPLELIPIPARYFQKDATV